MEGRSLPRMTTASAIDRRTALAAALCFLSCTQFAHSAQKRVYSKGDFEAALSSGRPVLVEVNCWLVSDLPPSDPGCRHCHQPAALCKVHDICPRHRYAKRGVGHAGRVSSEHAHRLQKRDKKLHVRLGKRKGRASKLLWPALSKRTHYWSKLYLARSRKGRVRMFSGATVIERPDSISFVKGSRSTTNRVCCQRYRVIHRISSFRAISIVPLPHRAAHAQCATS